MFDVVSWLRQRAETMQDRPFGAVAAAALNGAADDLAGLLGVPEAAPQPGPHQLA